MMPLTKRPPRSARPTPQSFRFDKEVSKQLDVLAALYNRTKTDVLEVLIKDEYAKAERKHAADIKRLS